MIYLSVLLPSNCLIYFFPYRSWFPSKKVLLATLLLITTGSVVLLTRYNSNMLQSWTVPHLSYKNQSRELGQSQSPRNFTSKATLYRDALKNLAESLHIPGNLKQSQTHSENRSSQRKDQTYSKNGLFQDERLKKVLEGKPESQINFPKGSAQHGTSKTVLEGNHGPQTKFPNKSVQDGASTKSESKSRQLAGTTPKPAEVSRANMLPYRVYVRLGSQS